MLKPASWCLVFAMLCWSANAQSNQADLDKAIQDIFTTQSSDFLSEFGEIVSDKPQDSFGAIEQCGEGADAGIHTCVPYYNCDGNTKTIITNGPNSDGFGLIDIRFGQSTCGHYMDVCCKIPEGGIPPEITTQKPVVDPKEPVITSTIPPVTPGRGNFCGIRNDNGLDFKITGNRDNEAEYAEFPWMLELLRKTPDGKTVAFCGASLITPIALVTGAHCVSSLKASDIIVRAGEWDTQTTRERVPYQERTVADIIIHPQFQPKIVHNDIAILILTDPFKKADNIGTVCMPPQGLTSTSRDCFVTGWGADKFGAAGRPSVILKKIKMPMVPYNQCQNILRSTRLGKLFNLHSSFVCAGGEPGQDACTGDGGGPLVCPDPNNPKRYYLTGIVSWGIGCGNNIPGVYADVGKFRSWVDTEMRKQSLDTTPYTV